MATTIRLDSERYDRNAREMHRERRRMLRKLVQIRKDRDHSQTEVARVVGVNKSTVSRFEDELENANPTLDTVLRYAHAVGAAITLRAETLEERDSRAVRSVSYTVVLSGGLAETTSKWKLAKS